LRKIESKYGILISSIVFGMATTVDIATGSSARAGSSGVLATVLWDRTTHSGEALDLSGYTQTFNDDFNILSITSSGCCANWYGPVRPPTGIERVVAPSPNGNANYFIATPGILTIRALKQADGMYTSGVMQTVNAVDRGWAQQKGYFEMRAMMPQGANAWPAFLLHSRASLAPQRTTNTETDIIEWYSNDPRGLHHTVHLWPAKYPQPGQITAHTYNSNYVGYDAARVDQGYHTYGCLIKDDLVIMYFDRKELARYPISQFPQFLAPVYMVLDLAVQGTAGTPDTLDFNIDYVRAWAAPTSSSR
jgi:hypothetical protein